MKKFFVTIGIVAIAVLIIGIAFAVGFGRLPDQPSENISKQKISDQKLPKPENFVQVRRDIQNGIFYDLENLSKDYYMQPDFYPSYKSNMSNMSNHDYTRWGVHGYGAFPGEISYKVENFKKGQYIDVFTFVKAGDNIETFQGMKFGFDISNNQSIGSQNDNKSQNISQLFDTVIYPNTVMFSPTFPERAEYIIDSRTYEWVYKLKTTIVAKTDIPAGMYTFKLKASPPDDDIQRLYYEDMQKINQSWYTCPEKDNLCNNNIVELRKKVYVNGGQFQADKFFNIIINVDKTI